jgi:hypothetical protein
LPTAIAIGRSPTGVSAMTALVRGSINDARIWSGLHFRNTMVESTKLGRKVAHHVAPHFFRQQHDD